MFIVINGRQVEAPRALLRYEDIVKLAFPNVPDLVEETWTVTYRDCLGSKPEGTLTPGLTHFVAPKDGSVFNVVVTGAS